MQAFGVEDALRLCQRFDDGRLDELTLANVQQAASVGQVVKKLLRDHRADVFHGDIGGNGRILLDHHVQQVAVAGDVFQVEGFVADQIIENHGYLME
ncbi:unnamed protein product [Brugia timori]|uniref:NAD-specific glutamate dehydrogenase n=1 Tax=Brugia timori TaxID=42155 RepID=A0A0R3Q9Y7_9BILA|nr:unnamed protein product [Brugia timori]